MQEYSPQAQALLAKWICLSRNMHSAIALSRHMQRKAEAAGPDELRALYDRLNQLGIPPLYEEIGRQMRAFSSEDGVERQFPEDSVTGPLGVGRFVEFRISEEAIPALEERMGKLMELVVTLVGTLGLMLC